VPGGVSLLAIFVLTRSNVVTTAASIATLTATAKSVKALRWLFPSLVMRDSTAKIPQRCASWIVPTGHPLMKGGTVVWEARLWE
jgi:hypothetical protein